MQQERRKNIRVPVKWPVVAETEKRIVYGTTADLSERGAFVRCPKPLEQGVVVDLVIQDVSLIDCPLPLDSFIRISAGVVRTQEYDPDKINLPRGMAVRFLRMSKEAHKVISTLITHKLQEHRIK
jgi:c-di-GMP-binding flagellar brake protein YcgR